MKKEGWILLIGLMFLIPLVSAQTSYSESTDVTFTVGGWSCDSSDTDARWVNGNDEILITNNCDLYSAEAGGSCCPGNSVCNVDGTCGPSTADYCWQYTTEVSCDLASLDAGVISVSDDSGNPVICTDVPSDVCEGGRDRTACNCLWILEDSSDEDSGQCASNSNVTTFCPSGQEEEKGSCSWTVLEIDNNCDNSLNNLILTKVAVWRAAGTGGPQVFSGDEYNIDDFYAQPGSCADVERIYQCPSSTALPFFTMFNLVIALSMISLIYAFYIRKK